MRNAVSREAGTNGRCRFLTVDAYREARGFYEKNGFVIAELPNEETNANSMTIPMFYDLRRVDYPKSLP
ncbi:MAG: GNAT family N-acetyltransferase [Victivallales bacterium]|jgi:hypothetical protein|nr:GNAT family N-acetyltransferase [Victivallales bacterium]